MGQKSVGGGDTRNLTLFMCKVQTRLVRLPGCLSKNDLAVPGMPMEKVANSAFNNHTWPPTTEHFPGARPWATHFPTLSSSLSMPNPVRWVVNLHFTEGKLRRRKLTAQGWKAG